MLITVAKYITRVVPQTTANSIVRALAAMTTRPAVSAAQEQALSRSTKVPYGADGKNVAWSWGDGPLVIFVHGWGGRAAQMAPLAAHVAAQGFRAVALDVTGHGASPKRHTRWEYFLRDLAELTASLGNDVYGLVGHSAGALTMMAARGLKGIRAQRYACICAPSFPFPPINVLRKKLAPKQRTIDHYQAYIAEQFGTTWEQLQTGSSYAGAGSDLLLIYDETDRFVSHTEGDRIKELCPGARLMKTSKYSHQKSVEAPEIIDAVSAFLAAPSLAS